MKIRLITILIVVLVLLVSFLLPITVLADNDKPPVQHHNQEDKTVPANCHSRHAREAGMECDSGTDDEQTVPGEPPLPEVPPNSTENPLPRQGTEPETNAVTTAPGLITNLLHGGGGGHAVHVMM